MPFQPGQSGNPSGRPAVVREWRDKCRAFMLEEGGFEALIEIANGNGLPTDRLKALMFLSDHGMGKAVTQIAGADESDFNKLQIIIQREPSKQVENTNEEEVN